MKYKNLFSFSVFRLLMLIMFVAALLNSVKPVNAAVYNYAYDSSFLAGGSNVTDGFNDEVHVMKKLSNGKIIVGGRFTQYNGVSRNYIAMLNADGSLDETFNVGTGFDWQVDDIAVQSDGKLLINGSFSTYKGNPHNDIVRLELDGSVDTSFDAGSGFNYGAKRIALQSDGKIIAAGGYFTSYQGYSRNGIVRINTDGTIDLTFTPNAQGVSGGGGQVYGIIVQSDGKIVVGGMFAYPQNGIARFLSNGTYDSTFPTSGNLVYAMYQQSNGQILIAYNRISSTIERYNADGTRDYSFQQIDIKNGSNPPNMHSIFQAPDGNYVVVGYFTSAAYQTRYHLAFINQDGTLNSLSVPLSHIYDNIMSVAFQDNNDIVIAGYLRQVGANPVHNIYRAKYAVTGYQITNLSNPDYDVVDNFDDENTLVENPSWYDIGSLDAAQSAQFLFDNEPIASTTVNFSSDRNWSGVSAERDPVTGYSFIHGFDPVNAPGMNGPYSYYIAKSNSFDNAFICPDATSLAEVSPSCTNKRVVTESDPDVTIQTIWGTDYYVVSGLYGYDVTATMNSVSSALGATPTLAGNAGTVAGATIASVEYSLDNGSWTSIPGAISFSITFPTPLADGAHTIKVRATDSLGNTTKEAQYGELAFTVDSTAPSIRLTQLGLITPLPDKTPLFYYFTSQTPNIKGKSEAGSTVHFKYETNDYTTVTNSEGNFQITIPELPRKYVVLSYYSIDSAGNKSATKILKLVIGEENFPQSAESESDEVETEVTVTPTPEVTIIPDSETETPVVPETYIYTIFDKDNNILPKTTIIIDGQKYVTNELGKVVLESKLGSQNINVEINGQLYDANVKDEKILIGSQSTINNSSGNKLLWLIPVVVLSGVMIIVFRKKVV